MAVSGNYAYVADADAGLQVIDVSNPANPQRVGGYDTSGYAYGVAVSGNYAYVADCDAGLQVIDVSNPANPQRVGGYDTSGYAYGVAVSGNYAYVADGDWGLMILGPRRRESPPSPSPPARRRFITPTRYRERTTPWNVARTSPRAPGSRSGPSLPPVTALPRPTVPPAANSGTIGFTTWPSEPKRVARSELRHRCRILHDSVEILAA